MTRTQPRATLERRLARLEMTRDRRPSPEADAAFAGLVAALDHLAALKAAGDTTAQPEIEALTAAMEAGQA